MPDTKPETATVKLTSAEQAAADAAIARFRREGKQECLKAVGIPAMILVCFVAYFSHYIPDAWSALRIGIQAVCVVVTLSALIGTTVLMFKDPQRHLEGRNPHHRGPVDCCGTALKRRPSVVYLSLVRVSAEGR